MSNIKVIQNRQIDRFGNTDVAAIGQLVFIEFPAQGVGKLIKLGTGKCKLQNAPIKINRFHIAPQVLRAGSQLFLHLPVQFRHPLPRQFFKANKIIDGKIPKANGQSTNPCNGHHRQAKKAARDHTQRTQHGGIQRHRMVEAMTPHPIPQGLPRILGQ